MEEEREGEADNPGPPKPGHGPKHTLTFDNKRACIEDQSTDDDDDGSETSSLEVFHDDPHADYDPGPHIPWTAADLPTGTVLFESANCTSFRAHLDHIVTRANHAAVYQEAKVPEADHERLKITIGTTHRRQALFTTTSPEHAAPAAGLAALAKQPLQVIKLKPRSQELAAIVDSGRIALNQFCLGAGIEFVHFNVYGWDGAHENHIAAGRTDALFMAIRAESYLRRGTPTMISGDINADTDDLETLTDMIQTDGWTDVGAHGYRWNARTCEPTCWAPNGSIAGTRRDFIFVNVSLLPFVRGFGVCPLDELPTHAVLQILLAKPLDDYHTTRAIKPASLHK